MGRMENGTGTRGRPFGPVRRGGLVAAVGLVLVAGCGVSTDTYRRDMASLSTQIAELEDDKERLVDERRALQEQSAAERGASTRAIEEALARVRELEAVAERRKALFDRITSSLRSMVSAGKLRVVRKRGMLIVQMAEAILFDTGKSVLKPEGVEAVVELTLILRAIPDRRFQIAGHTDDRGSEDFNWKLSCDRALSVLRTMREAGMPPERISVAGFAWFVPDATNDTEAGRAQNRRIEFILVPNLQELELP